MDGNLKNILVTKVAIAVKNALEPVVLKVNDLESRVRALEEAVKSPSKK